MVQELREIKKLKVKDRKQRAQREDSLDGGVSQEGLIKNENPKPILPCFFKSLKVDGLCLSYVLLCFVLRLLSGMVPIYEV